MRTIFLLLVIASSVALIQCLERTQTTEMTVNLRIEGDENTIFEGNILTKGTTVTTTSGGTHLCDGTNNNANTISGPTITSTLELAALKNNFTWDGIFYELYDDYSITRIGDSSQTKSQFWDILINYNLMNIGGCQQKVMKNDEILFAFDAFNKKHCLKLQAFNSTSTRGSLLTVQVTDGLTNQPIQGAMIENQSTNIDGYATLVFHSLGMRKLKAERDDSIRSNAILIDITE